MPCIDISITTAKLQFAHLSSLVLAEQCVVAVKIDDFELKPPFHCFIYLWFNCTLTSDIS